MLDVHIAGDKACALLRHRPQHSLPAFVNEGHSIEVHDAPSPLNWAVRLLPAGLQFIDPRRDEAALQRPLLFHRSISDCDSQHVPFPLAVHNANAGPQDLSRTSRDESLSAEPTNGCTVEESRVAGFKCRRWPTLVEKRFEPPTLFQGIAVSQSKALLSSISCRDIR